MPMIRKCSGRGVGILVIGIVALAGCAGEYVRQQTNEQLIELVAQADQADEVRLKVIEAVMARPLDEEQQAALGEQMAAVVKSPLHSPVIRQRVTEIIAQRYRRNAGLWLSAALIDTPSDALREYMLQVIVDCDDEQAVPGLVIALANDRQGGGEQAMSIAQTANRQDDGGQAMSITEAIETLTERPLESVCVEQIIHGESLRVQIAALSCLHRQVGRERTLTILEELPEEKNSFVEDIRFWARYFGYVPTNGPRFLMCRLQQDTLTPEQIEILLQRISLLQQREGYVFDVRDSYVLLHADKQLFESKRNLLSWEIAYALKQLPHTKRPPSYAGAIDDYREGYEEQCDFLSFIDLLRLKMLLVSLDQKTQRDPLGRLFRDDLSDIETETGGLCFWRQDAVKFVPYEPGRRMGDNQYHESGQMVSDGTFCLARWHLHADPWRGGELAGPGVDDLSYVAYVNCPGVVLTLLDWPGRLTESSGGAGEVKKINIDYFTPEGIVIDLGTY